MSVRSLVRVCVLVISALALSATLAAQAGVILAGRLLNSLSGDPIPDATVQIDELGRTATSAANGTFAFDNVPPGVYHLSVHSQGYSTRRTEVTVSATAAAQMDIAIDPELHFEEVTTVTGDLRSQFDLFQPTAVLAGQELTKQIEMSLGARLESQPGVASRSFGPAPARPVIRGLDGDRVLILQDGQRMGDLSSQSGDHGVTVNPASAQRIEVVRGPATLLYGANAIGGLVNVITEDIPTRPVEGATGNMTFDLGSAATETGGAADVHVGNGTFALHAGGGGRHSGDVRTPEGDLDNSQSRSGFGTVGLAWTGIERLRRRQLWLRRHEIRHPGCRGGPDPVDAAQARVLGARRRAGPSGGVTSAARSKTPTIRCHGFPRSADKSACAISTTHSRWAAT